MLSLVAGPERDLGGLTFEDEQHKFRALKSAAIYGPNAGGKSNLIHAISLLASLVRDSAKESNSGEPIKGISPFRLDREFAQAPCAFTIDFISKRTRYQYFVSLTADRVMEEVLVASPPPHFKQQRWVERQYDEKTKNYEWTIRGPIGKKKVVGELLKETTRDNALAISTGAMLNIEALKNVHEWFSKLWVFDTTRIMEWKPIITSKIRNDKKLAARILAFMEDAGTGITSFEFQDVEVTPEEVGLLKAAFGNEWRNVEKHKVLTSRLMNDSHEKVYFDLEHEEAGGTQKLFLFGAPVIDALEHGAVIFADELDSSLHPNLLRKIVEIFHSEDANKKGAQLVFTTHDTSMMTPKLFRRDQIYIAERNRHGATELYSLYDIKEERPRNNEAFERNYLAGRYGGVPQFGPTFEDLELK